MFRYGQAGAGNYEGCGRRDIESFGAARSRAGGVNESFVTRIYACRAGSHSFGEASQLFHGLAFQLQCNQSRRDLAVGSIAVK